jgi:outer membrane protein assembly factor BamB
LNDDTFAVVEDAQVMGVNLLDGSSRWERSNLNRVYTAMVNANRETLYVSNRYGRIEAFRIAGSQDEGSFASLWQIKLDIVGVPTLMPLPGGGVVVCSRGRVFGVSAAGALLWERDGMGRPFDWALAEDRLILSTMRGEGASMWAVDESGPLAETAQVNGRPVIVGDQLWVYSGDGIYRLDPETLAAGLLYALPDVILWWGDIVALPDGGVLVAHTDAFDKRLIALDADGALRWQRSYAAIVRGQQHLLQLDGRVYLVVQSDTGRSSEVSVFAIDMHSAEFTRIFTGGTLQPRPNDTWVFALDDGRMLLNIGGGSMVALDPGVALEAVLNAD